MSANRSDETNGWIFSHEAHSWMDSKFFYSRNRHARDPREYPHRHPNEVLAWGLYQLKEVACDKYAGMRWDC